MTLGIRTVAAADIAPAEYDEVAALCGWIFDCDYRALMGLCPNRTHVLGYDMGRLVSHALWLERPLRIAWGPWVNAAYVEGVATHPEYRRQGYAAAVMRRLQDEVRSYPLAALSPADDALGWYAALGWERWQGPLYIEEECGVTPTPGETVLIHRTPKTGVIDLTAPLAAPWRPFEWW